ncbi:MAG TPA: hypothetical protein VIK95_07950 [Egibacteraceae bacterium]
MRVSTAARYAIAGALSWNSVPHAVIAATGRRNRTPFGRQSPPAANALWSLLNLAVAALLIARADRAADADGEDPASWLLPFEVGGLAWTLFGVVYEWRQRPPRRRRR